MTLRLVTVLYGLFGAIYVTSGQQRNGNNGPEFGFARPLNDPSAVDPDPFGRNLFSGSESMPNLESLANVPLDFLGGTTIRPPHSSVNNLFDNITPPDSSGNNALFSNGNFIDDMISGTNFQLPPGTSNDIPPNNTIRVSDSVTDRQREASPIGPELPDLRSMMSMTGQSSTTQGSSELTRNQPSPNANTIFHQNLPHEQLPPSLTNQANTASPASSVIRDWLSITSGQDQLNTPVNSSPADTQPSFPSFPSSRQPLTDSLAQNSNQLPAQNSMNSMLIQNNLPADRAAKSDMWSHNSLFNSPNLGEPSDVFGNMNIPINFPLGGNIARNGIGGQQRQSVSDMGENRIHVNQPLRRAPLNTNIRQQVNRPLLPPPRSTFQPRIPTSLPQFSNVRQPIVNELGVFQIGGGPPIRGRPVQGRPPLQGPPIQGPPVQGPPLRGPPLQGPPIQGPPVQGPSLRGPPIQGSSIQGLPVQGPPLRGPPVQGPPIQQGQINPGNGIEPRTVARDIFRNPFRTVQNVVSSFRNEQGNNFISADSAGITSPRLPNIRPNFIDSQRIQQQQQQVFTGIQQQQLQPTAMNSFAPLPQPLPAQRTFQNTVAQGSMIDSQNRPMPVNNLEIPNFNGPSIPNSQFTPNLIRSNIQRNLGRTSPNSIPVENGNAVRFINDQRTRNLNTQVWDGIQDRSQNFGRDPTMLSNNQIGQRSINAAFVTTPQFRVNQGLPQSLRQGLPIFSRRQLIRIPSNVAPTLRPPFRPSQPTARFPNPSQIPLNRIPFQNSPTRPTFRTERRRQRQRGRQPETQNQLQQDISGRRTFQNRRRPQFPSRQMPNQMRIDIPLNPQTNNNPFGIRQIAPPVSPIIASEELPFMGSGFFNPRVMMFSDVEVKPSSKKRIKPVSKQNATQNLLEKATMQGLRKIEYINTPVVKENRVF
ncbi:uncharacterized protein LOC128190281 [Crassostrea angulata]|uniref:uncharacterized protein LOC128190281 n=1 Tax=Magallana angulata TaxID=2784310 RepID=UPI0022B1A3F4|nr:uncharacterized protein LOC128190281 [Crassostrea angulata]